MSWRLGRGWLDNESWFSFFELSGGLSLWLGQRRMEYGFPSCSWFPQSITRPRNSYRRDSWLGKTRGWLTWEPGGLSCPKGWEDLTAEAWGDPLGKGLGGGVWHKLREGNCRRVSPWHWHSHKLLQKQTSPSRHGHCLWGQRRPGHCLFYLTGIKRIYKFPPFFQIKEEDQMKFKGGFYLKTFIQPDKGFNQL